MDTSRSAREGSERCAFRFLPRKSREEIELDVVSGRPSETRGPSSEKESSAGCVLFPVPEWLPAPGVAAEATFAAEVVPRVAVVVLAWLPSLPGSAMRF